MTRMRENHFYTPEAIEVGHKADNLLQAAYDMLIDQGFDPTDVAVWLFDTVNMMHTEYHLRKQCNI